jgi:hypothetical protein
MEYEAIGGIAPYLVKVVTLTQKNAALFRTAFPNLLMPPDYGFCMINCFLVIISSKFISIVYTPLV